MEVINQLVIVLTSGHQTWLEKPAFRFSPAPSLGYFPACHFPSLCWRTEPLLMPQKKDRTDAPVGWGVILQKMLSMFAADVVLASITSLVSLIFWLVNPNHSGIVNKNGCCRIQFGHQTSAYLWNELPMLCQKSFRGHGIAPVFLSLAPLRWRPSYSVSWTVVISFLPWQAVGWAFLGPKRRHSPMVNGALKQLAFAKTKTLAECVPACLESIWLFDMPSITVN